MLSSLTVLLPWASQRQKAARAASFRSLSQGSGNTAELAEQTPGCGAEALRIPAGVLWLIGQKGTFGGTVAPYEVFPGEPIGSWKSAWQRAKKAAGVECRWHDLRHSFISLVAEARRATAPSRPWRVDEPENDRALQPRSECGEDQSAFPSWMSHRTQRGPHKIPHSGRVKKGRSAVNN